MLLVTGSDGLVGSAIRRMASDSNVFFATRSDADLTDFEATQDLFSRVKPDRVIHLAALVGGIGGNLMHAGEYFRNNILINLNVLEAARLLGVERLISFMSTCIFPNDATYPLSVDQLHQGAPHPSNFGYAYAKRMLDVQTRAYREQWGTQYSIAIPTNIYGPQDNFSLTEGHVAPALIHKTFLAKAKGEPLVVWGSGEPLREFIYSDDVARVALWMVGNYDQSAPLIVTSGVETSIRSLVRSVTEAMGFDGPVIFDAERPDGQFRKPSDAGPIAQLLPKLSFTPVDEGISETVGWFMKNYPNVRM